MSSVHCCVDGWAFILSGFKIASQADPTEQMSRTRSTLKEQKRAVAVTALASILFVFIFNGAQYGGGSGDTAALNFYEKNSDEEIRPSRYKLNLPWILDGLACQKQWSQCSG